MREPLRYLQGLLCALVIVAVAAPLAAQSNVTTGELLGRVQDSEGGVLPGASVEARNPATGLVRRAVTGSDGSFRFQLVPVGVYEVRAELAGFRPELRQGIQVGLGSSVKVDFVLELGTLAEEITVTAAAPVVETTRPDVANAVSEMQIATLPLNGRDFLDFINLTPQSNTDDDGRAHIGGMRGIQNSFNIDGANSQSNFFGEERGGTRPPFTFSQAAIKEFQVIPSSYNVQFGNASGGIINAVTKSGTNDLKGEVWYYLRDQSFVDEDAFGREPTDFDQKQFGAAAGGPMVKDRLHYFVSYDGQRRSFPVYREFYNFPAGREADFERLTGLKLGEETFGNQASTDDANVVLAKLDWQFSPELMLTFRHNYSSHKAENGTDTRFTTTARSNNGLERNTFNSSVFALNAALSQNAFNELIFQYSDEERPRYANATSIGEVRIGSAYDGLFGRKNYLPNNLIEKHVQLIENFVYFTGNHAIKAGFSADLIDYNNWFPRYAGGQFYFRSWNDFFNGNLFEFTQAFYTEDGRVKFKINHYAGYVQDEWRVNPGLTINAGIRYDLQNNPNPKVVNQNFTQTGTIDDDTNNWAPRVGFAWDPFGKGRTVVRGGAGYFYDTTPALLLANVLLNNGISGQRYVVRCSASNPCPTFPNLLPSPGSLTASTPSLFVVEEGFENPRTKRISLGAEQQVGANASVGAEFIWSETDNLERLLDLNLVAVGTTPWGGNLYDYRQRNYSGFGTIAQITSDARGDYRAFVLKGKKRWADNWMFDASYTYSRARDNNSNERTVSINDYASGEDPLNIENNWGPANFDIRHRFVGSATVRLPWGFQAASIVTISSGYPFTPTDGRCWNRVGSSCYDPSSIRYRAYWDGVHYGRNSFRQPYYRNVDLRISKAFSIAAVEMEIIGEAFNLLGADNLRTSRTQLVTSAGALDANFGALNLAGRPRQYQLGLKVRY